MKQQPSRKQKQSCEHETSAYGRLAQWQAQSLGGESTHSWQQGLGETVPSYMKPRELGKTGFCSSSLSQESDVQKQETRNI